MTGSRTTGGTGSADSSSAARLAYASAPSAVRPGPAIADVAGGDQRRFRQLRPGEPVAGRGARRGGDPGRDGAERQRLHRHDGRAVHSGRGEGDGVALLRRDPDPQAGRAGRQEGRAGPAEREPSGTVRGQAGERRGVQRGVQQRGVDDERRGFVAVVLGEGDFGVDVVAVAPGAGQALEHRAVPEAALGHRVVEAFEVDGFGAVRRPGDRVGGLDVGGGHERAARVPDPGRVRVTVGPRVDPQRATAFVVRSGHRDLQDHAARVRHDQRGFEGELVDLRAARLVSRRGRRVRAAPCRGPRRRRRRCARPATAAPRPKAGR